MFKFLKIFITATFLLGVLAINSFAQVEPKIFLPLNPGEFIGGTNSVTIYGKINQNGPLGGRGLISNSVWYDENIKNGTVRFPIKIEWAKGTDCSSTCSPLTPTYTADGYSATLTGLTPNQKYFIKVTILSDNTSKTNYSSTDANNFVSVVYEYKGNSANTAPVSNITRIFLDKDYTLLAPIGDLRIIKSTAECQKILQQSNNKTVVCDINTLISFIFKTLVSLTAVVLVIRLMVVGYEYMITDMPFKKAGAKEDLMASLAGLVLALSAWLILNTINPKLLENNIEPDTIRTSVSSLQRESDPGTFVLPVQVPVGAIGQCPSFLEFTSNGQRFITCSTIKDRLKKLIDDSWTAGIRLSGFSLRTLNEQVKMREINCPGKNPYTADPVTDCDPDTAKPGESAHEWGFAFDLTCDPGARDGNLFTDFINPEKRPKTKECFDWLNSNASVYGITNYAPEPWHWSFK